MASGTGSGGNGNDNLDYVVSGKEGPAPTLPTPNSDTRFTAILEQLVKSHKAQVSMQEDYCYAASAEPIAGSDASSINTTCPTTA